MTISFDDWATDVVGKWIDRDGYGVPVWQCHDVWLDFLIRVAGGTQSMGYAPSGYTDSVWTNFPVNGVNAVMTKHSGTAGIRRGDVVFWAFGSANYPLSHVAVALSEPSGGYVQCLSQNNAPGGSPTQVLSLTLSGAYGYLRPIVAISPTPNPIPEEEEDMPDSMYAVVSGVPSWTWINWATGKTHTESTQAGADWVASYMGSIKDNFSADADGGTSRYNSKLALLAILD